MTTTRVSERAAYRGAAAKLRANAGIGRETPPGTGAPSAQVGAAARRLRRSIAGGPDSGPDELRDGDVAELQRSRVRSIVGTVTSSAVALPSSRANRELAPTNTATPARRTLGDQQRRRAAAGAADHQRRHRALTERAGRLLVELAAEQARQLSEATDGLPGLVGTPRAGATEPLDRIIGHRERVTVTAPDATDEIGATAVASIETTESVRRSRARRPVPPPETSDQQARADLQAALVMVSAGRRRGGAGR